MVYESRFAPIDIPDGPLIDFIFEHAAARAEKAAFVDGIDGEVLTYGDLVARIEATAAGLARRGLRKGDVCAVYSPNVLEYAVIFFGIMRAGGIVSTVNPLYAAPELTHQLRDCGAKFLITSSRLRHRARKGAKAASVEAVFVMEGNSGRTSLSSLDENDRLPEGLPIVDGNDSALLPYSSGTTGLPKGVVLTHRNVVANVAQIQAVERLSADEVLIATLPFYHIYGMVVVLLHGLRVGATLVVLPRFRSQLFLAAIERYRVTTAYLVPPIVRMLATSPKIRRFDLSSLGDVISAAAPLPDLIARACIERFRCTVRQMYGLTEAGPATHAMPRGEALTNAAGYVLPNTQCRIVGVASKGDAKPGELGEVWVRGPQVMRGYWNNPEATAAMLDADGWLRTGDIGFVDANERLHVVDRAKDLIKFRGLHYASNELLRAMVEDIQARRSATERVRFQALLLDSVRESVIATDARHRVIFWNRGAEALFGYQGDQALGQQIDVLLIPVDNEVRRQWQQELASVDRVGTWQGQVLRRRRDGSLLWTDLVVSVIVDEDGAPRGYVSIHRDVTEVRHNEKMLRDSREQLRNLTSSLMRVREEERAAISREVHDELGQALTRLKIDLQFMTNGLVQPQDIARGVAMHTLVDNMVKAVQHVSLQLRPAILDDLGLEAAIESYVHDFSNWKSCQYDLRLNLGDLRPNGDRDTAVFRILQEALTNVARHSRATLVSIHARLCGQELVVEVEDNGVGIPPAAVTSAHSLGLIGMRERAEGLGGQLSVAAQNRRGSVVSLRVPLVPTS